MQVENHKEEVPFSFYEEKFRALQPENVLNRLSGVTWDGKEFTLTLCCGTCWKAGMWHGKGSGRPSGKCPGVKCISPPIPAGC